MVRAILEGRKTQTRRIIKLPNNAEGVNYYKPPSGKSQNGWADPGVNYWTPDPEESHPNFPYNEPWPESNHIDPCPFGQIGGKLWVRETFGVGTRPHPFEGFVDGLEYKADEGWIDEKEDLPLWFPDDVPDDFYADYNKNGWTASIHMPRWASRITLKITNIRVERLQDISEDDCKAEGVTPNSVLTKDKNPFKNDITRLGPLFEGSYRGAFISLWNSINTKRDWDSNPWVWALEFEQC